MVAVATFIFVIVKSTDRVDTSGKERAAAALMNMYGYLPLLSELTMAECSLNYPSIIHVEQLKLLCVILLIISLFKIHSMR